MGPLISRVESTQLPICKAICRGYMLYLHEFLTGDGAHLVENLNFIESFSVCFHPDFPLMQEKKTTQSGDGGFLCFRFCRKARTNMRGYIPHLEIQTWC